MAVLRFVVLLVVCSVSVARAGTLLEEANKLGATTVVDLLKQVGLGKNLETDYLTLFLPTNQAFADLPDELSKTLISNQSVLTGVLLFHATNGIFRAQDAFDDMMIKTSLPGSSIRVNTYDDENKAVFITVNGAKVLQANVPATNGIIHLIDRVMLPPLGDFYQLVSMSEVHTVLKGIIDTLGFQKFLETTSGTVFAPTDAAFADFTAARKAAGKADTTDLEMRETIMYHLLPKVLYSAGARNGTYTTMDKGEQLSITLTATRAMINQATVVVRDIPATNGVVHVIDKVLIPKAYDMHDDIVG